MEDAPSTALARGKINVTLDVLGRRSDGYHEVATVLQEISLHDEVRVQVGGTRVVCHVEGADLPSDEGNLAYRAAALVLSALGVDVGVRIRLIKRIPAGAGFGGGSTDAAAVLRLLPPLLGRSLSASQLQELAAALGSDVPFFLLGGTALGTGRGERVMPLPSMPLRSLVVACPRASLSTAEVYAAWDRGPSPSARGTPRLVRALLHPAGRDPWTLAANDLAGPACRLLGGLSEYLERFGMRLSGSGPGMYRACADAEEARLLVANLRREGLWAEVVTPVAREGGV